MTSLPQWRRCGRRRRDDAPWLDRGVPWFWSAAAGVLLALMLLLASGPVLVAHASSRSGQHGAASSSAAAGAAPAGNAPSRTRTQLEAASDDSERDGGDKGDPGGRCRHDDGSPGSDEGSNSGAGSGDGGDEGDGTHKQRHCRPHQPPGPPPQTPAPAPPPAAPAPPPPAPAPQAAQAGGVTPVTHVVLLRPVVVRASVAAALPRPPGAHTAPSRQPSSGPSRLAPVIVPPLRVSPDTIAVLPLNRVADTVPVLITVVAIACLGIVAAARSR